MNQVIQNEFGMRIDAKVVVELARRIRREAGLGVPMRFGIKHCLPLPEKYALRVTMDQHGVVKTHPNYAESIDGWTPKPKRWRPMKAPPAPELPAAVVPVASDFVGAFTTVVNALAPMSAADRKRIMEAAAVLLRGEGE